MQVHEDLSQEQQDAFWMQYALELADKAEQLGEVPVGAVIVAEGELIAEGWNRVITDSDPTAHAEVVAMRNAGTAMHNYRLVDTTLYVTLEPCPMCAGALVHARVGRVVYAAPDPRTGAAGSVFQLLQAPELNHQCQIAAGVLQEPCAEKIRHFFKRRRREQKQAKVDSSQSTQNSAVSGDAKPC
ncbi:tRNA adenosine(34) deaminase TadA [Thiomicrorhabdus xiamenensis]|uniref:tRNA-specific adenosine deaminase n=1 Tax=Thiomicrorhabdus xiamenensis TaxID=2739063 RepID=A0A7D4NS36_9GAMM|nr:tRNA adenosine(34) deaminase TadA [Thiomicrorhabdus xiamenensis]QKI89657.1 tRNA adenosine(34) deaminase TadA [Thiomicrorhabdus xiamenensis]